MNCTCEKLTTIINEKKQMFISFALFCCFISEVMSKDCQIQIEQTLSSKDLSPYSGMSDRTRSTNSAAGGGKTRPSRTKARRSPYPQFGSGSNTPDANQEYQEKPFADYMASSTTGSEVGAVQSYHSMMYGHTSENIDRYSALYSTPYPHPGVAMYRDAACVYSYPTTATTAHQRYLDDRSPYRGYEERFYPARDPAAYPGYLSSNAAIQSAAVAATNSRLCQEAIAAANRESSGSSGTTGSSSQNSSSGVLVGNPSYADFRSSSQCSRSSSRDNTYSAQHYSAPYSNRSESSASEVDVCSSEEYEKQRQSGSQAGAQHRIADMPGSASKYEPLMESQVTQDDRTYKGHDQQSGSSSGSLQRQHLTHQQHTSQHHQQKQHSQQGVQRESSVPHPVIMRRRSSTSTFTTVSASATATSVTDNRVVTPGSGGGGGGVLTNGVVPGGGSGGSGSTDYGGAGNSSAVTAFNHKTPSAAGPGNLQAATELRSTSTGSSKNSAGLSAVMKPSVLSSVSTGSSIINNNNNNTTDSSDSNGCVMSGVGLSSAMGGVGCVTPIMPIADAYMGANDKLHSMRLGMGTGMGMGMGMGMGVGMAMGGSSQDYSQCLKAAACGYDNYTSAASMYQNAATLQAQRAYPVVPQAGYTSVIVDPQQYHLTNGYAVH